MVICEECQITDKNKIKVRLWVRGKWSKVICTQNKETKDKAYCFEKPYAWPVCGREEGHTDVWKFITVADEYNFRVLM